MWIPDPSKNKLGTYLQIPQISIYLIKGIDFFNMASQTQHVNQMSKMPRRFQAMLLENMKPLNYKNIL
jgi:hypothetical protein